MMYIDPDGRVCRIILKGHGMAMVEYPNGYVCFWVFKCLRAKEGHGLVDEEEKSKQIVDY